MPTAAPMPIPEDTLYEVVDGQIVEKPMGAYQIWVAIQLVRPMVTSNVVSELGQVVSELLFVIDRARNLKRRPDVAFVSFERWPRHLAIPDEEAWDVVPDLAVEVISRSNAAVEVQAKIRDYFKAGVRQVWVIYPKTGQLYAYDSPTSVRILGRDDMVDGAPLLPGFRIPLASLFDTPAE
ncbi:MAG: Uma2 family endonuclease [Isosphaeraceae bacterium]|nr:Uma2 family endonuclease [Isosphaeraceae bacterium]